MARVRAHAGAALSVVALTKKQDENKRRRTLLLVTGVLLYSLNAHINLAKLSVLGLGPPTAGSPRYSVPRLHNIEKSNTLELMYNHANDKWFRQFFRCSKDAFDKLVALLKPDPVFKSNGKKPQRPVWIQVATFLRHHGAHGGRHHIDTARDCGIAEGSVYLYIDRVITALERLRHKYIVWPEGAAADRVKNAFAGLGFPNCLGAIDGSLIKLACMPEIDPLIYYCRKKIYAINISAVVDAFGAFIFVDIGWPGGQNDISILKRSQLWRKMREFFPNDEYLLADRGYITHRHFVRPYSDQDIAKAPRWMRRTLKKWNQQHSKARIKVEHVFGLLKGRFPALKDMPGRSPKRIYHSVHALMILHNIFLSLKDDVEEIDDYEEEPVPRRDWGNEVTDSARNRANADKEAGVFLREELLNYM